MNFILLAWFAAIWLLAIFALVVYYALALVTLLDGVEEVTTFPPAQEGPAPSGGLQNAVHHVLDDILILKIFRLLVNPFCLFEMPSNTSAHKDIHPFISKEFGSVSKGWYHIEFLFGL